jgi:Flp pilus assembly protein TadD
VHAYSRRTAAGAIEAIKDFSAVVRKDSTHAGAWTGLAQSYVRAYGRNFDVPGVSRDSMVHLAVAAVERALAADPRSTEAWVAQAMVSRMTDPTNLEPALRSLRRALSLDSTLGQAWHNYAVTLADRGDFPGAISAWRRCVTVAPARRRGRVPGAGPLLAPRIRQRGGLGG